MADPNRIVDAERSVCCVREGPASLKGCPNDFLASGSAIL